LTQNTENTQAGVEVLTCKEAMCEDNCRTISPKVSAERIARNPTCTIGSHSTIEVIDLYSVRHTRVTRTQLERSEAIPFIHQIELEGPQGEIVRVRALFDDGAMISAMCTSVFEKVKHRLNNWSRLQRRLRMVNGDIVEAVARWTGTVQIEGIKAQSTFEVFNSRGNWGFLIGKLTLQAFAAVHEYTLDIIEITDQARMIVISNQIADQRTVQGDEGANLMLDEKQQRVVIEQKRKQTQEKDTKLLSIPIGQWRPTNLKVE
jgi:hypothetical protein